MGTEQSIIAFTDAVDLHGVPYVEPHYAAEQEVASFTLEGVERKILLGHLTPYLHWMRKAGVSGHLPTIPMSSLFWCPCCVTLQLKVLTLWCTCVT